MPLTDQDNEFFDELPPIPVSQHTLTEQLAHLNQNHFTTYNSAPKTVENPMPIVNKSINNNQFQDTLFKNPVKTLNATLFGRVYCNYENKLVLVHIDDLSTLFPTNHEKPAQDENDENNTDNMFGSDSETESACSQNSILPKDEKTSLLPENNQHTFFNKHSSALINPAQEKIQIELRQLQHHLHFLAVKRKKAEPLVDFYQRQLKIAYCLFQNLEITERVFKRFSALTRYRCKKANNKTSCGRKHTYLTRKVFADSRPRFNGRFLSATPDTNPLSKNTMQVTHEKTREKIDDTRTRRTSPRRITR